MTNLHYEFTGETTVNRVGLTLHRIRATRDLPHFGVKAGEEGGWIEHTGNLAGNAWVDDEAQVFGGSEVFGNAQVFGNARVFDSSEVSNDAHIESNADYFHAVTCTSSQFNLTLTRQKNGGHHIIMGCWSGNIDKFEALIAQPKWIETKEEGVIEARPEMEALALMMRARIERWK